MVSVFFFTLVMVMVYNVENTAYGAFVRGYQVVLVEDCCGDRSLERHQQAISLYGNYIYRVVDTAVLKKRLSKT